jgi:hypothetical protein
MGGAQTMIPIVLKTIKIFFEEDQGYFENNTIYREENSTNYIEGDKNYIKDNGNYIEVEKLNILNFQKDYDIILDEFKKTIKKMI